MDGLLGKEWNTTVNMLIEKTEKEKIARGEVTLVGVGRLGFRTAKNLMQIHRGGPVKINLIDGQKVSADDLILRFHGGEIGEYKVDLVKKMAGPGYSREICTFAENITEENLGLLSGNVICIEIAGGDTLPVTASIIKAAKRFGAATISTMGVFGIGEEEIKVVDIKDGDPDNPIVSTLRDLGIKDHILVGTGKLIRDWEPVTPYILDKISDVMCREIIKLLHKNGY
jgi:predicted ThiF/HesA family dinucleotide-utilizing enzyme